MFEVFTALSQSETLPAFIGHFLGVTILALLTLGVFWAVVLVTLVLNELVLAYEAWKGGR